MYWEEWAYKMDTFLTGHCRGSFKNNIEKND